MELLISLALATSCWLPRCGRLDNGQVFGDVMSKVAQGFVCLCDCSMRPKATLDVAHFIKPMWCPVPRPVKCLPRVIASAVVALELLVPSRSRFNNATSIGNSDSAILATADSMDSSIWKFSNDSSTISHTMLAERMCLLCGCTPPRL